MSRYLALALALAVTAPSGRGALPTWDPASTWVVLAGVVRWNDPSLGPFAARHRKDVELMDVLAKRGVPDAQRTLLIDGAASASAVIQALGAQVAAAPKGSTFLVYFEGHGVYDAARQYVLATSETDTDHLDVSGLGIAALLPVLAVRGATDRVLLLADACYSGHLALLASALTFLGVPSVSLTSAAEASASSENWTYTQALIDALEGRPIIDRDGDGLIRLAEAAEEARLAMRFREGQPIGWAPLGFPDLLIARAAPWPAALLALDPKGDVFARGDWVVARRLDGQRSIARVLGGKREEAGSVRLRLEYYDYTDRLFGWAREAQTDPVMFQTFPVGARLRVKDDEVRYVARVLRVEDGLHLVTFLDFASGQAHAVGDAVPADEFVTPDQILGYLDPAQDAAERVLVEADGDLYEAVVKGRFHGEVCVRYPGSPLVEDDCVPEARVRPDTRAP